MSKHSERELPTEPENPLDVVRELLPQQAGVYRIRSKLEPPLFRSPRIEDLTIFDPIYRKVILNLLRRLPPRVVVEWYSSQPKQTGRKMVFPFLRIDTALCIIEDNLLLSKYPNIPLTKKREYFLMATIYMAKVLTWLKIGYENDISKFATHENAIRSWTGYRGGHFATLDQKSQYIQTEGFRWINRVVEKYITHRLGSSDLIVPDNDPFIQYNLLDLLSLLPAPENDVT